jgi:Na+-driven multidrug efflux pump
LYYDFVKNDKDCKEFNFYRKPSWEMFSTWTDDLSTLVKRGADQAVNFGIDFSLFLVMTFLSGSVAKKDQAAMSYNLQYMNLELMFSAAFAFTCTRAVSTELSNKKFISAEMTSEYGLLSTLLCLTPIPAILAVACAFSPKILGASAELEDTLQTLVPIMCAGVIFETARFGLLHQLRTTGDTFTPNMIAFGMLSCGMGLSAALGLKTSLGVNGVGLGYAAGNAGTVAVLLPRKRNKLKELSKKEEQKTGLPKLAVTISDKVVGKFAKRNGAAVMSIVVQAPDANANNTSNASTLTAVRVGEKEPAVDSRPS